MTHMTPDRLWAKSKQEEQAYCNSMSLPGHLADVYAAAKAVLLATGDDQLRALGLDPEHYRGRLHRCVLLAAAVHDLGKANNHFQEMIRGVRDVRVHPQGVRHEWVTVLMLRELKVWLLPAVANDTEFALVEWAVSGHHPAHNHPSPPRTCPPGAGAEMRLCISEADFSACLDWLRRTFHLSEVIPTPAISAWPLTGSGNAFGEFMFWYKSAQRRWESIRKNTSDDVRLLAAVKNCLVASDIAGSALPQVDPDNPNRWDWITLSFAEMPQDGDLDKIVKERSKGFKELNPDQQAFQAGVRDSLAPVTFLKAGCGSGKTLSAYMWAAKNHPRRRLFFCYPTTGTATEGFKDYLHEPDVNADLFHSRRTVDFEIILGTDTDSSTAATDAAIRIESLDAWSTPIVACTVDTVLGIVQNNKRGLFAWPALAQSAFVFDEIHAYDDRLFGALLRFLRDLPGLPSLLMTASLPKPREEALKDVLKEFRGIDLNPICGPKDLEERPRYHKATVRNNDPLPMIEAELKIGGKVLWVCNTVQRVMNVADRALHLNPLIYHSRFKYVDRVERHKEVVAAFQPENTQAMLAITSQVCEMSLDLKGCTLLVTDNAPVPSLIQRLGRLNRAAKAGDPTRPFVVIEPDNNLPYTLAELDAAMIWLEKLPNDQINQLHLVEAWEQSSENPPDLVPSAWLDGGPITAVSELREASPGITVVMRGDLQCLRKSSDLGRYALPMPPPPRNMNWQGWPKYKGIPIAENETIIYDAKRGAAWQKQ